MEEGDIIPTAGLSEEEGSGFQTKVQGEDLEHCLACLVKQGVPCISNWDKSLLPVESTEQGESRKLLSNPFSNCSLIHPRFLKIVQDLGRSIFASVAISLRNPNVVIRSVCLVAISIMSVHTELVLS